MSEDTGQSDAIDQPAAKKAAGPRGSKKTTTAGTKKTTAKKTVARKKPAATRSASKTQRSKAADATTGSEAETLEKTRAASDEGTQKQTTADTTGDTGMNTEHEASQSHTNTSQLMEDLKGRDWPHIIKRAFFMFFFGVLGWMSMSVAFFLAAVQIVFTIFAGEANTSLARVIKQFANYIHDILGYLSFSTDETPFPFDRRWPDAD